MRAPCSTWARAPAPTSPRTATCSRSSLAGDARAASTAAAPAIDATAEALPFDDDAVDAAMAMVTVHQWADPGRGLAELRRVAREPVVVLTLDPDAFDRFWMVEYVSELFAAERRRFPSIAALRIALGGWTPVEPVPVPLDCTDGFAEAFYGRPERCSTRRCAARSPRGRRWTARSSQRFEAALRADLACGAWDDRHGAWRARPSFEGSLRLVVALPVTTSPPA